MKDSLINFSSKPFQEMSININSESSSKLKKELITFLSIPSFSFLMAIHKLFVWLPLYFLIEAYLNCMNFCWSLSRTLVTSWVYRKLNWIMIWLQIKSLKLLWKYLLMFLKIKVKARMKWLKFWACCLEDLTCKWSAELFLKIINKTYKN